MIVYAVFLNFDRIDKIQTPVFIEIYKLKKNKKSNNRKTSDFEHQLIFGQTKSSEINPEFISKLKNARYKKNSLDNETISKISEFLNSKKKGKNSYETACKKYLEILLFLNNKIK